MKQYKALKGKCGGGVCGMYRVAIVEDEASYRQEIHDFIIEYGRQHKLSFSVQEYPDGTTIAEDEEAHYDIVFFDIELPGISGMEAARILRSRDETVVLVFITNMAQYAIEGYSVGALDFVLKPLDYYSFAFRMERALERVRNRETTQVVLSTSGGMKRLDSDEIYYVEIQNRLLHYHTKDGEIVLRGTMQSAEELLRDFHFTKCNHWYLVNLKYVTEIQDQMVTVAGSKLEISRRNKSAFTKAVTDYFAMQS
jgi:DNA-binding LytR/AlgR family response regulator